MDSQNIVEYIKKKYPKVVFEPVVFQQKKALGFIVSDNKLLIGYINSRGIMCKLVEPIDLSHFVKQNISIQDILKSLPVIHGFTENDRSNLLALFKTSTVESVDTYKTQCQNTITQLQTQLVDLQKTTDTLTQNLQKQTSDLQSEKSDSQKQIASLQSQTSDLQSEKSDLQTKNTNLQKDIDRLTQTLKQLELSQKDVSKTADEASQHDKDLIAHLQSQIADMETKYVSSQSLHATQIKQLEQTVSELQKLNDELSTDLKVLPEMITKREHNQIVNALQKRVDDLQKRVDDLHSENETIKVENKKLKDEYKTYYDSQSNEVVSIRKRYEDKISKIQAEYSRLQRDLDECKNQLVNNKDAVIEGINKYKTEMQEFIKNKDLQIADLQSIHTQNTEERKRLTDQLNSLLERERKYIADLDELKLYKRLPQDWTDIDKKRQEFAMLQTNIKEITDELKLVKEELSRSQMQSTLLEGYNTRCKDKILNEKQQIIDSIKQYNAKWGEWAETIQRDAKGYKLKLLKELRTIQNNLQKVFSTQTENVALSNTTIKRLKQNIADIETELKRTINDQIIQLSAKEERIAAQDEQIKRLVSNENAIKTQFTETITDLENTVTTRESEIQDAKKQISELQTALKRSLADVDTLLKQNQDTKIDSKINYDDCYTTLKNFVSLNNIFYRKQTVIRKLDDIINNNLDTFSKLDSTFKNRIRADFNQVKTEITNHITFLNLKDYINSPNLGYLKIPATRDRVPESFCTELANLLEYWNTNKTQYRQQDRILSNIYEDLAGVARIYIRIKPDVNGAKGTVSIETIKNEKQRSVVLDCKGADRRVYGDFYGVFDETFTNLDIFTGVQPTLSDSLKVDLDTVIEGDSISPGLYHNFRQLQDGYSIVMFGYGNSGSGKTFTLLGSKESPGVLHYGLANLQNVETIRIKYLFEQYYNRINFNNRQISGAIHNLIGKISQLQNVSKDEISQFAKVIPSYIDTNNLRIEDLYVLTGIIDKYRIDRGRIKRTPNNNVSSRSHLFFVFEISFKDGKTGYLTIVDMGGRESPVSIFNMFIDTNVTKLQSVMAPPPVGGVGNIQKTIRSDFSNEYTAEAVFDILREGFYTNETLNHLIYYLNKKNGKKIDTPRQSVDERTNVVYKIDHYFVQPKDEETRIDTVNNCLTIPILKFLDTISNKRSEGSEWKPTKFVMIGCVRQEQNYCEQTVETMNLLQHLLY